MAKRQIRPIRIEGNVAFIPLTKGYEAIIDAADVPLVEGHNWCARVDRKSDGSIRCAYAFRAAPRGSASRLIHLHRLLQPATEKQYVDHVDGDGLNNRRSNLRAATPAQNAINRKCRVNSRSGYKGVALHGVTGKWAARISVDGRERHIGLYGCVTAAAVAYAKASRDLHGEFGRTT